MIVLGFSTTMSGEAIFDQTENSRVVGNPYKLITMRKHRDSIKKGLEIRELVPFIITTIIKLVNQNLDRPQKVPEESGSKLGSTEPSRAL
jgi:hypothetical protein